MYLLSCFIALTFPHLVQDGLSQDIDNAIGKLVSEAHSESQEARAELIEMGRKATPQLVKELVKLLEIGSSSVQQRHMICEILGKIRHNDPTVLSALGKALSDRDEFGTSVASVAASSLAWIGDDGAIPALIKVIEEKEEDGSLRVDLDLQLKYETIRALGVLRAEAATDVLRSALKDKKTTQLGPQDDWAHLIAAAAAEALGYIRATAAVEDLGALLGDGTLDPFSEKPLQWHAARALERITGKTKGDLNGPESDSTLVEWKKWYDTEIKPKDEPKADDPKADDPKADDPKADDPKADDPKADDPKADDPKSDEPNPDEPKKDGNP